LRRYRLTCALLTTLSQNEEQNVGKAIKSALQGGDRVDVVVVDGHSRDGTVREAKKAGATVICMDSPGRGTQMNKGANATRGDVIMFLHADSTLPSNYKELVESSLACDRKWGCFRSIDIGSGLAAWVLKQGVTLRTTLFHKPYGDQCIFVKRNTFREMGGYRDEWKLLEDVDLVSRLDRAAGPPAIVPHDLEISGRRWRRLGFLKTTLLNQYILMRHAMGADISELAELYDQNSN
jgi:rSAM/selenodomain-associated transferase 2